MNVHKYLKGGYSKDRVRLFSVVHSARTGDREHELEHWVCLHIRKQISTVQRLPREVVESPSLQMLRSFVDMDLGNWLWISLPEQGGWTR